MSRNEEISQKLIQAERGRSLLEFSSAESRKIVQHARQVFKLIGIESFIWMASGIFGAMILSALDYSLAILVQMLFKSVGFNSGSLADLPFLKQFASTDAGVTVLFLIVGISRGLVQFFVNYSAIAICEGLTFRFRRCGLEELLIQSGGSYVSPATMNFRMSEVFPKAAQFCYNVANIVPIALNCFLLLGLMLLSSFEPTITAIVGLFFTGLMVLRINRSVRTSASRLPGEQSALLAGIDRVAKNWLLVRIFRTNHSEYLNLITNAAKYWQHSTRGLFFANLAGAIPTIAGTLMLVIILTLNQQVWHIAGAQIVTVLYLLIRFVQALGNGALHLGLANSNWTHFKSCYLHFKGMRLENLSKVRSSRSFVKDGDMAVQHSKTEAQGSNNENSTRPRLPPEISLENVSFTYPGQDKATLSGLSMYIQAGSIFGIKGRSGAGKSTLVNLMLGILSPDSGRVRLSGTDPETYLCRSETRVGYVGPEPFLFEGSILANLLYGNPEKPSSQQIKDALEAAHLLSVIESHPQGLNHTIRGNGEGLSAGQKQRLGLARALLRQPQLLILDEASANLDETTEKIVANSIGGLKGKCTVIIISHRIGFFSHVDTLYDADTNSHENIGPNDLDSEYQAMKVT